jgi:hypothetical protein
MSMMMSDSGLANYVQLELIGTGGRVVSHPHYRATDSTAVESAH